MVSENSCAIKSKLSQKLNACSQIFTQFLGNDERNNQTNSVIYSNRYRIQQAFLENLERFTYTPQDLDDLSNICYQNNSLNSAFYNDDIMEIISSISTETVSYLLYVRFINSISKKDLVKKFIQELSFFFLNEDFKYVKLDQIQKIYQREKDSIVAKKKLELIFSRIIVENKESLYQNLATLSRKSPDFYTTIHRLLFLSEKLNTSLENKIVQEFKKNLLEKYVLPQAQRFEVESLKFQNNMLFKIRYMLQEKLRFCLLIPDVEKNRIIEDYKRLLNIRSLLACIQNDQTVQISYLIEKHNSLVTISNKIRSLIENHPFSESGKEMLIQNISHTINSLYKIDCVEYQTYLVEQCTHLIHKAILLKSQENLLQKVIHLVELLMNQVEQAAPSNSTSIYYAA